MGQLVQKDGESINSQINSPESTEEIFDSNLDGSCKIYFVNLKATSYISFQAN